MHHGHHVTSTGLRHPRRDCMGQRRRPHLIQRSAPELLIQQQLAALRRRAGTWPGLTALGKVTGRHRLT
jgi:hypothetical protein